MATFALRKELGTPYDKVLAQVPEALKSEGFGVLTEIDVQDTLKQKLGIDFRRYRILGACNPPLAHRVLLADLDVGLTLPCNLVVYEGDGQRTVVAAVDPTLTLAAQSSHEIMEVAELVRGKLARVLEQIE
jgi:uncharacterized protein (DUF302 family)